MGLLNLVIIGRGRPLDRCRCRIPAFGGSS